MPVEQAMPGRLARWISAAEPDWDAVYADQLPRVYNFFRYRFGLTADAEDLTARMMVLALGVMLSMRLLVGPVPVRPLQALPLMALEIVLLMTVSIAGGTRLTTVTNGVTALGFYGVAFVGGWIEQIGGFAGSHAARTVGIVASLISPADALWRLGSYRLQPESLRNIGAAIFTTSSVPTTLMVWRAAGFTLAALIVAVRSFSTRQL